MGYQSDFLAAADYHHNDFVIPEVEIRARGDFGVTARARVHDLGLASGRVLYEVATVVITEAGPLLATDVDVKVINDAAGREPTWLARLALGPDDGRILLEFEDASFVCFKSLSEETRASRHSESLEHGCTLVGTERRGERATTYVVGPRIGSVGVTTAHEVRSVDGVFAAICLTQGQPGNDQHVDRFEQEVQHLSLVDRFEREIQRLRLHNHRHVLRYVDQSLAADALVLITEPVTMSLADNLRLSRPTTAEALSSVREVLDGLHALHSADQVVGDLTPKSIMVTNDGRIVVSGIGALGSETDLNLTSGIEERQLWSQVYISAERRTSTHRATPADDIFTVGQLAYLLLAGHVPIANQPPIAEVSEVTPSVAAVIDQMRSFRREDRHSDAGEALEALDRAMRDARS